MQRFESLSGKKHTNANGIISRTTNTNYVLTRSLAGIALVQAVAAAPLLEPSAVAANGRRHRRGGLNPHLARLRILSKSTCSSIKLPNTNGNDASKQQQTT